MALPLCCLCFPPPHRDLYTSSFSGYGGHRTGRGAGDDAPQGGIRRYPHRGRTGGHVHRRGGRSGAGSSVDPGRKGGFLGPGAGPMEGVDSPETHALRRPKAAAPPAFSPSPALPGFVHLPLQRCDVGEGAEQVGAVQAVAHRFLTSDPPQMAE